MRRSWLAGFQLTGTQWGPWSAMDANLKQTCCRTRRRLFTELPKRADIKDANAFASKFAQGGQKILGPLSKISNGGAHNRIGGSNITRVMSMHFYAQVSPRDFLLGTTAKGYRVSHSRKSKSPFPPIRMAG